MPNPKRSAQSKRPSLLLIGVGNILASMIVAGFLLGYLTDLWLGTQPILMVCLGALGFVGGLLKVYKMLSDPELY